MPTIWLVKGVVPAICEWDPLSSINIDFDYAILAGRGKRVAIIAIFP